MQSNTRVAISSRYFTLNHDTVGDVCVSERDASDILKSKNITLASFSKNVDAF